MSTQQPYEIPTKPQQVTVLDTDGTAWPREIINLDPSETAKEWALTDWEESTLKNIVLSINRLLTMGYPPKTADNLLTLVRLHLTAQFKV